MKQKDHDYSPPFTITPLIVDLVERVGEYLGMITLGGAPPPAPRLRRESSRP